MGHVKGSQVLRFLGLQVIISSWVQEGGGGHPTWLLLVVQQLVAGLKVLVTILTAVLPLLVNIRSHRVT